MKCSGGSRTTILACGAAILSASLLAAPALEAQTPEASARRAAAGRQVHRLRLQQRLALRQAVRIVRGLGLTGEQRQQMRELVQQRRPQFSVLVQQLAEARRGIRSARQATPVDEAAVTQLREQAAKLRQDITALRKQLRADAFKLLTPEQREKLKAHAGRLIRPRQ